MDYSNRTFVVAAALAVGLAVAPFPGRWAILQQLLPVLVVAIFYWRSGYSLERASLAAPSQGWIRCGGSALVLAGILYVVEALLVQPLARLFASQPKDLTLFEPIEGSLGNLAMYLGFMWMFAAFGEEFLWRGFLLRQIADREKPRRLATGLAITVSAALFGLAHAYQGTAGVVEKFLAALILGAIYVKSGRSSIWLVVFIHGFQNTISFIAIYLGIYDKLNPFS